MYKRGVGGFASEKLHVKFRTRPRCDAANLPERGRKPIRNLSNAGDCAAPTFQEPPRPPCPTPRPSAGRSLGAGFSIEGDGVETICTHIDFCAQREGRTDNLFFSATRIPDRFSVHLLEPILKLQFPKDGQKSGQEYRWLNKKSGGLLLSFSMRGH